MKTDEDVQREMERLKTNQKWEAGTNAFAREAETSVQLSDELSAIAENHF